MFFSISKNTKYKNTSIDFINYFVNDINANKVLIAERGVPVSSMVRDCLKDCIEPSAKKTFDYIDKATEFTGNSISPEPVGSFEIQKLALEVNNELIYGILNPEKAARKFINEANNILNDKNSKNKLVN